jgi:hypothetical protein
VTFTPPDMTAPRRMFIADYQFCVQCPHWLPLCRYVLNSAEDGAWWGDQDARRQGGSRAPIRGLLPQCAERDKRREEGS